MQAFVLLFPPVSVWYHDLPEPHLQIFASQIITPLRFWKRTNKYIQPNKYLFVSAESTKTEEAWVPTCEENLKERRGGHFPNHYIVYSFISNFMKWQTWSQLWQLVWQRKNQSLNLWQNIHDQSLTLISTSLRTNFYSLHRKSDFCLWLLREHMTS